MRILKIESLPKQKESWVDKDHIMLHACFQLLKDFIEKEDGLNHCAYDTHREDIEECRFLNEWWKSRENNEQDNEMLLRLIKVRGFLWT